MRIAITGHTKGLGAELTKRFQQQGHTVKGYARSNGYDLRKEEDRSDISQEVQYECDVFINNAYAGFMQVDMLNRMYSAWKDVPSKYIINIGSSSSYHQKARHHPYAIHKIALDEQCRQLQPLARWPVITNIRPGTFESDMGNLVAGKRMKVETAADVVMYVFNSLNTVVIKDICYESV